jgi:hypothetical protein
LQVRWLEHSAPRRRNLEVAFVLAEKRAHLSNVTDKIEGHKVRFVNDLVELESTGFVELRPRESIHISATTPRDRFPVAVIFNPGPAAAARRRISAFLATDDCSTSSCVRSAASRIGPAVGDGGSRNAAKLA